MTNDSKGLILTSTSAKLKLSISMLLALAVLVGGAYLVGLNQKISELQVANARASDLERELSRVGSINLMLYANDRLYRSLIEMDNRNFGTSNAYVRDAESLLRRVNPKEVGLDEAKFLELQRAVEETRVLVAEDVANQRARVLGLIQQLGGLIPQ